LIAMVDAGMVKEVKGLVKEGYPLEKIRANMIKIGYSEQDADDIIGQATNQSTSQETNIVSPPAEEHAPETGGLKGLQSPGGESEEDLLLAADESTPILPSKPVKLPEVKTPPVEAKEAPKHHRHGTPVPKAPEAVVPNTMGEETKPKSGAGKAIVIIVAALVVVAVMAYFLLLPKLGIALTL